MVRERLAGSQNLPGGSRNISLMTYFCLHSLHDMTISSLDSSATSYVSEQHTLVRCSLTHKITVFNLSYVTCIIFVGGYRDHILR